MTWTGGAHVAAVWLNRVLHTNLENVLETWYTNLWTYNQLRKEIFHLRSLETRTCQQILIDKCGLGQLSFIINELHIK